MGSIMLRSFANHHGIKWPADVACLVDGEPVTWAEIRKTRRERQERIMRWKRRCDPPRIVPCYIWAFCVPGWIYGGWHCYVVTLCQGETQEQPVNFGRGGRFATFKGPALAESIMREIPLGFLPLAENWERWVAEFAKRYPRRHPHDPRKAGSRVGWLVDGRRFCLAKPKGAEA